jgi:hypothetical protein
MSFDIDPDDKYQRILMYHPESDCVYEVFSVAEKYNAINADGMSYEVTGDVELEERFKREQDEKKQKW